MGRKEARTENETESGTENDDPTATAGEIATRKRKPVTVTEEEKGPGKQRRMDDGKTTNEIQQELRRLIGEKTKWKMEEQNETMSYDYHERWVSPRTRSVEGTSSIRLSGHLVNGDVAGTDRAVIPTGDVGGEGKYHPGGNG
jgi:hypothetical protein